MQRHLDSIHDATLAEAWGHPDSDIIRAAAHVFDLLSEDGLDLDEYGFGIEDDDTIAAEAAVSCCLWNPEDGAWSDAPHHVREGVHRGLMAFAWGRSETERSAAKVAA